MSATQKTIDMLASDLGMDGVDPVAVMRFINESINQRPVDPSDAAHAALLIAGLVQGVRGGDDVGVQLRRIMDVRKARAKLFDPNMAVMGSSAWAIVEQYVRGKISHTEAVGRFQDEVQPASKRQREAWIAAIKPRVKDTLEAIDQLIALSETAKK